MGEIIYMIRHFTLILRNILCDIFFWIRRKKNVEKRQMKSESDLKYPFGRQQIDGE